MKKLVIISHTDHQIFDGRPLGWAPTINEINYLAQYFEEIVHVACLEEGAPRGSSVGYTSSNIKFVPIPTFGGPKFVDKIGILVKAPRILKTVRTSIKGATHVQLRLPMGIGLFLLPFFSICRGRSYKFWVKYANDWGQKNAPPGYALQRWMLSRNIAECPVTINGSWSGQPKHCFTFKNPCLNDANIEMGYEVLKDKKITLPYRILFVGRIEEEKGIFRILDALKYLDESIIHSLTVVGSGRDEAKAKVMAKDLKIPVVFTGLKSQSEVHEIMAASHLLLLPTTASEGFPKVAAEAMNYGCITIISKIGSIPHYLEDRKNALLLDNLTSEHIADVIKDLTSIPQDKLIEIQENGHATATQFSFKAYLDNLIDKVF